MIVCDFTAPPKKNKPPLVTKPKKPAPAPAPAPPKPGSVGSGN